METTRGNDTYHGYQHSISELDSARSYFQYNPFILFSVISGTAYCLGPPAPLQHGAI